MNKRTIGECFYQIRNGANIKQGMVEGGFPITRIETIANDKFNRDRMGYAGITDAEKYKKYILEDGDLLMSHINSTQYLGRTVLYKKNGDEKIIHGMNLLGLKSNREIIEPAYAKYYFYSKPFREQINRITKKSVNQASFAVADLKRLTILVPPLSKQHEVVDVLDKINQIITFRQQQLAKLDELVKAWFVEMFICKDNPMVTLDSLTLGKSEYGAQSASAEYDSNRPRYIRITDINDDGTLNNDIVSSVNIEDDQRYKLTYGDFLFARMGATVGKTYAYKSGDQIFAGYLIRYKLNLQKIMPEYLFAYTKLEKYKKWVLLNQSGAAQPGINAKKYGSLQIPLAPLEEQRAFTNFVRQTDKSRLLIRKSLEQMETLKKALMQQYFG